MTVSIVLHYKVFNVCITTKSTVLSWTSSLWIRFLVIYQNSNWNSQSREGNQPLSGFQGFRKLVIKSLFIWSVKTKESHKHSEGLCHYWWAKVLHSVPTAMFGSHGSASSVVTTLLSCIMVTIFSLVVNFFFQSCVKIRQENPTVWSFCVTWRKNKSRLMYGTSPVPVLMLSFLINTFFKEANTYV